MCGFQGALNRRGFDRKFLGIWRDSRQVLRHRGPDATGEFSDDSLLLLFHRLAILDLSDNANQPMYSRDGRLVLVWNGELYNYVELRRDFLDDSFRVAGDTEVALGMLSRFGLSALAMFRGMFAFALWDVSTQVLTLCRDRFGIKPLFWSVHGDSILFASEIKGVLALGRPASPNLHVIANYLNANRAEEGVDTFFLGINRVAPGEYIQFQPRRNTPTTTRWYDLPVAQTPFAGSRQEAADELVRVLTESCKLHTRSDVGFAVNVSGGVDSSLLVALSEKFVGAGLKMFSVDYPGTRYSERPFVEALLDDNRSRSVSYTEIDQHKNINFLDDAVWSQDEPFGGLPALAWYPHFENVRECGFKVVLDGSGLDDLLGGYLRHVLAAYGTGAIALEPDTLSEIAKAWGLSLSSVTEMFRAFDQPGIAIDGTSGIMHGLCRISVSAEDEIVRPRSFREHLAHSFGDSKLYRAMRYKDRASMWRSIELRVPFVDHIVAEFCLSLPASYVVGRGEGKVVLREAVQGLIPKRLAYATKRSVQSPQREFMTKGPFADALNEALENPSDLLVEVIDIQRARDFVQSLHGLPPSNSNPMWQWLNLDRWAQRFL
jgi:asparagine synthase (glutamine-hydrolysing)